MIALSGQGCFSRESSEGSDATGVPGRTLKIPAFAAEASVPHQHSAAGAGAQPAQRANLTGCHKQLLLPPAYCPSCPLSTRKGHSGDFILGRPGANAETRSLLRTLQRDWPAVSLYSHGITTLLPKMKPQSQACTTIQASEERRGSALQQDPLTWLPRYDHRFR